MKKIKKILLAMAADLREANLLNEAIFFSNQLEAKIDIIHVNPKHAGEMSMMMDSIKMVTDKKIMEQIENYGLEDFFSSSEIIILKSDKIEDEISILSKDYDMVILGHRKMGEVIENISDSIDQDIANEVHCPVLIINKDLNPKD